MAPLGPRVGFLVPLPLRTPSSSQAIRQPYVICLPQKCVVAELQQQPHKSAESQRVSPSQYVPLHVHSDYSLLDGASQLPSLVNRAAELDVPALALTDHGVLYGAIQLVRACAGTSVKPIIGNEMYIVNDIPDQQPNGKGPKKYHLIVLAKNQIGYRNLVKLTSMAHLDGVVGKGIFARPCINKAQLYQYREGLIVSSACLGGEIAQAILNDEIDSARTVASWFRDVFGDDFYLEIQDHGSDEDRKVNPVMLQLSRELSIKVIATNDSHFTNCLDAEAHDALICIQTGKRLTDENRLRYSGTEYFKSAQEMRQCFVDHLPLAAVDEALHNTLQVAKKIESYDLFGATRIPDFPLPTEFGTSHDDYLRHVSELGLKDRIAARMKSGLIQKGVEHLYLERLHSELDMICRMGFSSYFLVVWDYIRYARSQNIPVGPGRGSVAGSLVAFALRITDVDPIPFNLLFERFLNIERRSMPDIDTDFSVQGREKVISYVTERYGQARVAQIITFNRLTSKALLKDVARVHNVPYKEADRLAKLIPVTRGKPASLKELLSKGAANRDFKKEVTARPEYSEWLDKAKRIEGTNKTFGIHAAGVVISANPLTDIVPLTKAKHGETITQYAMEDVESLGLLKMDFLGLKNLSVIQMALTFINDGRREKGIERDLDFSVDALPLDDDRTYKLLADGELDGIFQLDASAGMRNIVRELRPTSLEDISSILALYRPGPLDAGLIPKFIRRKHGLDPVEYEHPLLEPILKETYGIMVYQEQIMRIARDLAGYSLGQADILRRAMGKKKMKDMEKERPRFVRGAKEKGVPEETATDLFDKMVKFAEYCFNKSHSTAYAYLTYQTAFLKANYPVEYCSAVLTSNMQQSEKLVRYLADARMLGVKVLPPSVNKSDLGFTVDRNGDESVVRFGFEAVKAVGASVSKALIDERNARGSFRGISDLINRVDLRVLNKRALAALIQAGAFEELHPNRRVLLNRFDELLVLRRKLRDRRKRRENKGMSEKEVSELNEMERLAWEEAEIGLARACEEEAKFTALERLAGEKASIGFYASGHPLHDLQSIAAFLGCTPVQQIVGELSEGGLGLDGSEVTDSVRANLSHEADIMILSCITELKKVTTAKGRKMARWMIEDTANRVAGVVFPGFYEVVEQRFNNSSGGDVGNETDTVEKHGSVGTSLVETEEEPHFVVENDARVIVWGRVDSESSGTVQIIVDDVLRVEQVRAIVATARYTPDRSADEHIFILQEIAKDVLGDRFPQRRRENSGGFSLERRKWMKSKPLKEKNRVPLILRCLDEQGNTARTVNVGNDFRFPMDCQDEMVELQKSTGYECALVSISENMDEVGDKIMLSFDDIEDTSRKPPNDSHAIVTARHTKDHDNELTPESYDMERLNVNQVSPPDLIHTEDASSGAGERSNRKSRHETAQEVGNTPKSRTGRKVLDNISAEHPPTAESEYVITTPISHSDVLAEDKRGTARSIDEDEELLSRRVEVEKRCMAEVSREDISGIWSRNKRAQFFQTKETNRRSDPFHEQVFCYRPGMNEFSPSDAFVKFSVESEASVLTASRETGDVRDRLEASLQASPFNQSSGAFSTNESDVQSGHTRTISEGYLESPAHSAYGEDWHSQESPFLKTGSSIHDSTQDYTKQISVQSPPDEAANPGVSPSDSPPTSSTDLRNEGLKEDTTSNELVVDFDASGMEGVLDAVCLVGSEAARRYSNSDCALMAITDLNFMKLVEAKVRIAVNARVSYTYQQYIYVQVDLRETEPSSERKRVRSFGPVTIVTKGGTILSPVRASTKKTQKLLNSTRRALEHTLKLKPKSIANTSKGSSLRIEQSSTKNAKRPLPLSSTLISLSENCETSGTILMDGGQILCSMNRAALLCVENTFKDAKHLRVISVSSVASPKVWASVEDVQEIMVSALVYQVSSKSVAVQATSNISGAKGHTAQFTAIFSITCQDSSRVFRCHLIRDRDPLFDEDDAERCFHRLLETLPECLQHE